MVRFETDPPLPGYVNMARDAGLLQCAESGVTGCRVYSWDGPWVSLGRSQSAQADLLDPGLVPWVTRPTGGKAVLHGHDVTVGLAVPLAALKRSDESVQVLSRSVKMVYRRLAKPLIAALRDCGHDVALGEETLFVGTGRKTSDCFAHVSPNDIVCVRTGAKACGCALRLTARAVLLQASIPDGSPLVDPRLLFSQPHQVSLLRWDSSRFAERLRERLKDPSL